MSVKQNAQYKCPQCGHELHIGMEVVMGGPPKHKCPNCHVDMVSKDQKKDLTQIVLDKFARAMWQAALQRVKAKLAFEMNHIAEMTAEQRNTKRFQVLDEACSYCDTVLKEWQARDISQYDVDAVDLTLTKLLSNPNPVDRNLQDMIITIVSIGYHSSTGGQN
jgi:predicted RNA-binding Zn-ribbon protein involved in translation (DUF1610 family)